MPVLKPSDVLAAKRTRRPQSAVRTEAFLRRGMPWAYRCLMTTLATDLMIQTKPGMKIWRRVNQKAGVAYRNNRPCRHKVTIDNRPYVINPEVMYMIEHMAAANPESVPK